MRASSLRRSTRLTSAAICPGPGGGRLSSWLNTWRTWAGVTAGVFPPQPPPLPRQEPQRQQRQRHVVVPAHPRTHLVLPQADLALALPEHLLHPVPLAVYPHQRGQRLLPDGVAHAVPRPRLPLHGADDDQRL